MDSPSGAQKAWFPVVSAEYRQGAWPFFFEAFLERQFFAIFVDVGSILGSFWKPKWKRNSILGRFFFDVFFERVSLSILNRILEARNLKNSNFLIGKQRFLQNRRFRKNSEKSSILASFWEAKTMRNREKSPKIDAKHQNDLFPTPR